MKSLSLQAKAGRYLMLPCRTNTVLSARRTQTWLTFSIIWMWPISRQSRNWELVKRLLKARRGARQVTYQREEEQDMCYLFNDGGYGSFYPYNLLVDNSADNTVWRRFILPHQHLLHSPVAFLSMFHRYWRKKYRHWVNRRATTPRYMPVCPSDEVETGAR